jgi:hypothetical protein
MLRLLISDITVVNDPESKYLHLQVRWQGGATDTPEHGGTLKGSGRPAGSVTPWDYRPDAPGLGPEAILTPE